MNRLSNTVGTVSTEQKSHADYIRLQCRVSDLWLWACRMFLQPLAAQNRALPPSARDQVTAGTWPSQGQQPFELSSAAPCFAAAVNELVSSRPNPPHVLLSGCLHLLCMARLGLALPPWCGFGVWVLELVHAAAAERKGNPAPPVTVPKQPDCPSFGVHSSERRRCCKFPPVSRQVCEAAHCRVHPNTLNFASQENCLPHASSTLLPLPSSPCCLSLGSPSLPWLLLVPET